MRNTLRTIALGLGVAAAVFASQDARAAIVKASINVINVTGNFSAIDASIPTPASFVFSFTYDTNATDNDPDPRVGSYSDAIKSIELDFGIIKLSADVDALPRYLSVYAPTLVGGDMLTVIPFGKFTIEGGANSGREFVTFSGELFFRSSLELLQSDAPPTSLSALIVASSSFGQSTYFSFGGQICDDVPVGVQCQTFTGEDFHLEGISDLASFSLSVVPEPATFFLFGVGLAGLSLATRLRVKR